MIENVTCLVKHRGNAINRVSTDDGLGISTYCLNKQGNISFKFTGKNDPYSWLIALFNPYHKK